MRVLVTRPEVDAGPLVEALEAAGHSALVEPLLEIRPALEEAPELSGLQALLFTSANGVRALAALSSVRDLPVFTVGDASAEAARAEGFTTVESAGGDVEDLARLVRARLDPAAGPLLHGAGATLAGDLKGLLEADGFTVRRVVLYNAKTVEAFSDGARQALRDGSLDAILLFSPRTAETFAALVKKQGLAETLRGRAAVCLSPAVAGKIGHLRWADLRVARQPNQRALLAALGAGGPGREMSEEREEPAGTGGPTQEVIAAFGGIRPMANKLGVAVSTVQGWKERGVIPPARRQSILEVAKREGIEIDAALLETGDRPAAEAPVIEAKPESVVVEDKASAKGGDTRKTAGAEPPPPASGGTARPSSVPPSGSGKAPSGQSGGGALVGGIVIGGALAGLGFLAAVLTVDLWRPLLGAPEDEGTGEVLAALDELSGRIAAQDRRLQSLSDELESMPAGVPGEVVGLAGGLEELTTATEDLTRRVAQMEAAPAAPAGLEARLSRLESRAGGASAAAEAVARLEDEARNLAARLGRLEDGLESLRERQAEVDAAPGGQILVLLALAEVREALDFGRPYGEALDRLRAVAGGDPAFAAALDRLAAKAETGVPTLSDLRTAFATIAGDVVAAGTADQYDGMLGGTLRRLLDTITIRPVGQVEGADVGAVVARAEQRLAEGDLAAAVTELEALDGAAAEAVAGWLETARARLAARAALSEIVGLVAGRATD